MPHPRCSDQDFIALFEQYGPAETARRLKMDVRTIYDRRVNLEKKYQRQINPPPLGGSRTTVTRHHVEHAARLHCDVLNGVVLVGSDAHIWPGPLTTAMRGFIKFAEELKPRVLILNGDVLDFPQVSRHPRIGWEGHPTVVDEIEAAKKVLAQIEDAVPRSTKLIWTLGNHDGRFETRLATVAPEYAKLHGVHLKDHFSPKWNACWSIWINNDVVVKHRFKGGIHAPYNNTVYAGKSIVTGHLHSAKVTPFTDYNGDRYGADTGCLAHPDAQAFLDYTEDAPKNWRSGFLVLTFKSGVLLQPELALVYNADSIQFRGEIIRV